MAALDDVFTNGASKTRHSGLKQAANVKTTDPRQMMNMQRHIIIYMMISGHVGITSASEVRDEAMVSRMSSRWRNMACKSQPAMTKASLVVMSKKRGMTICVVKVVVMV